MRDLEQRAQVVFFCQRLDANGWCANHNSNISVRLSPGRFLTTPSGIAKRDVTLERLIEVDEDGIVLAGRGKVFSEWPLHRAAYRARSDVAAVVHAHSPYATALAAAHIPMPEAFQVEAVVTLGPSIPLTAASLPFGEEAGQGEQQALIHAHAVLMAGHGPLVVGTCLEQAFLRLELVEELAHTEVLARSLGGTRPLPPGHLEVALAKHRQAGLEPGADHRPPISTAPVHLDGKPPQISPDPEQEARNIQPAPSAWSNASHVRSEAHCGAVYGAVQPGGDPRPAPQSFIKPDSDQGERLKRPMLRPRPTAEVLRAKVDEAIATILDSD